MRHPDLVAAIRIAHFGVVQVAEQGIGATGGVKGPVHSAFAHNDRLFAGNARQLDQLPEGVVQGLQSGGIRGQRNIGQHLAQVHGTGDVNLDKRLGIAPIEYDDALGAQLGRALLRNDQGINSHDMLPEWVNADLIGSVGRADKTKPRD